MRTTIVVPVGRATYDEYDTPQGWRDAIQAGDLRRETIVTVYRGDEPALSVPARQVRELDELFDELLGVLARKPEKKPKGVNSVAPEPTAATSDGMSEAVGSSQNVVPTDASVSPPAKSSTTPAPVEVVRFKSKVDPEAGGKGKVLGGAPADADAQQAEISSDSVDEAPISTLGRIGVKKSGVHPLVWILVCAIVLFAMTRCVGGSNDGTEQSGSGALVTAYAVRDLNMRRAPSRSAELAGGLNRAAQITGRWVDGEGERWLSIVGGTHDGAYVWAGNLGETRPPTLRGYPQTLEVRQAGTIHSAPDESAPSLQVAVEGQSLNTIGRTDTGWTEVTVSGAGVGYIRDSAFVVPVADERVVEAEDPAASPTPSRVCRTVREARGDQLYCREGDGLWLAQGTPSPVRVAPPPPPTRPTESPATITPPPPSSPAPSSPSLISRPRWLEQPDGGIFARFIPQRALEAGQTGRVGLDCAVNGSGRLENCRVSSETPTGCGFGSAALRVPPYFRMATTDLDGQPTPGRRVRFAVTFAVEDE